MIKLSLDEIEARLNAAAGDPLLLFGPEEKAHKTYLLLQTGSHTDKNPGELARAETLFKEIERLYALYKNPPPPIVSPSNESYRVGKLIAVGDVADIYNATTADASYILKISRVPGGDKLLINEAEKLTELRTAAIDTTYLDYFPALEESFPAKDKFQKHVNVFPKTSGWLSLVEVQKRKPNLPGEHLAWIFNRLLIALGFSHRQGIAHGAILPSHVMIDPVNHALQLIGWGHSVPLKNPLTTISTAYRAWYPAEVLLKKPVMVGTDLFMAAKCIVYLGGGDLTTGELPKPIPRSINRFIRSCLLDSVTMRPTDAWKLFDEFRIILHETFGPPKFHHLDV
jgi:hypothetical protein